MLRYLRVGQTERGKACYLSFAIRQLCGNIVVGDLIVKLYPSVHVLLVKLLDASSGFGIDKHHALIEK